MSSSILSSTSSSAPIFLGPPSQEITRENSHPIMPVIPIPRRFFQTQINPVLSEVNLNLNQLMTGYPIASTVNIFPISSFNFNTISLFSTDGVLPAAAVSMSEPIPNQTEITKTTERVQKINQKAIQKATNLQPSIKHEKRKLTCRTCDKVFTRKEGLKIHKYSHLPSDQWPLECTVCPRLFYRPDNLKMHEKGKHNMHGGMSKHACTKCEKTYKWRGGLTKHMGRMHNT